MHCDLKQYVKPLKASKMTTEEKIKKTEGILRDLLLIKDIMDEKEFWDRIDFHLDYLIPLYKERNKKN